MAEWKLSVFSIRFYGIPIDIVRFSMGQYYSKTLATLAKVVLLILLIVLEIHGIAIILLHIVTLSSMTQTIIILAQLQFDLSQFGAS